MKNILRAVKLLPKYKSQLFWLLLIAFIGATLTTALPLAIQRIIDDIIEAVADKSLSFSALVLPLVVWAGMRLSLITSNLMRQILKNRLFRNAYISFRRQVADRLHTLSINYYEKHRTGKIVSEANQSPIRFAEWLSDFAEQYSSLILNAAFALVVLAYKSPFAAIVTVILATIYVYFSFKSIQKYRKFWSKHRELINEYSGIQHENVSFVAHIRALGVEKLRNKLFTNSVVVHNESMAKMFRLQQKRGFVAGIIELLVTAIPLGIFVYLALRGSLRPTDVYVATVYLGMIGAAITRLNQMWSNTADINDTLGETLTLLDNQDDVSDPENPQKFGNSGAIELQNVSFQYAGTTLEALSNMSLKIEKGQTVALVGRSGSGKSTITKLLLRFYDPSAGEVIISGTNIKNVKQVDLRKRFGVVMQDVALFNDTVFNNISIARPEATKKEVEAAAKLAHAHEFISDLPAGYDTLVGERGVKLSGGEKQRVSIARAVLRNPEIILLDEATSALDSESEKYVQDGLKKLLKGRTAIIIAHRLSTIAHADKIVVLDKGKIVEEGTFEELKKSGGAFANLLAHQQL